MDFGAAFKDVPADAQLYMCGPGGFMDAIEKATEHWPSKLVRKEYFSASGVHHPEEATGGEFTVTMAKSGKTFSVGPDEKLSDALRENGYKVALSCAEGFCGSCLLNVISGEIQHNDLCLSDGEKKEGKIIAPCVSRGAPGTELVLDI